MNPPHRHDDAMLVRRGTRGMYWQARDGMVVQVAAREDLPRYVTVEPRKLEACAPEGGVVYTARADAAPARDASSVGAAGLAMALWMRLFADTT
ncbi:MAG: hypothetical protein ABI881_06610 [Betaproteobacteria bacterium]